AILAVWAVRKHGVPVDRTMALVEARFRASQRDDGSWCYNPGGNERPDSMTCAGLLGLAVGHSTVRGEDAKKAAGRDAAIEKGLLFLAKGIGKPGQRDGKRRGGNGRLFGANSLGDLYYLWSVERVAVAYDLADIAGKDWYSWGSELLVEHQNHDGSW